MYVYVCVCVLTWVHYLHLWYSIHLIKHRRYYIIIIRYYYSLLLEYLFFLLFKIIINDFSSIINDKCNVIMCLNGVQTWQFIGFGSFHPAINFNLELKLLTNNAWSLTPTKKYVFIFIFLLPFNKIELV